MASLTCDSSCGVVMHESAPINLIRINTYQSLIFKGLWAVHPPFGDKLWSIRVWAGELNESTSTARVLSCWSQPESQPSWKVGLSMGNGLVGSIQAPSAIFSHGSWAMQSNILPMTHGPYIAVQCIVQHMSHGEWGQCTAHGGWRINYPWVMGCTVYIVGPCPWIIGCTTKIWSTYFSWTMGCTGIYLSHRPWNVQ